jgi:hypothetical protein
MSGFNPSGGGLGSTLRGAYGGIYSFFSTNLSLNLLASNVPTGVNSVTFSFLAGGGSPALTYSNSSVVLNYNAGNPTVVSSAFSTAPSITVATPIGDQELIPYTWSWTNLSLLGASSAFSIAWKAPRDHSFITDIAVTQQVIPEPSTFALLGLVALLGILCRRKIYPSRDK